MTPVLMDFWAANCGPCRPTLAFVESLHRQYPKLRILSVDMDDASAEDEARGALQSEGVTYPVVSGPRAASLARRYSVQVYPSLFLIDSHGKIVWSHSGLLSADVEGLLTRKAGHVLSF